TKGNLTRMTLVVRKGTRFVPRMSMITIVSHYYIVLTNSETPADSCSLLSRTMIDVCAPVILRLIQ
ncbi:unnamed protein product, partial [Rangifer tarandus platyrhynchus]